MLSIAVLVARKRTGARSAAIAAGFVIPVTLFAIWILQHPAVFQQTAQRYNLIDPRETATASGILRSFDVVAMADRYRNFFGDRVSVQAWRYLSAVLDADDRRLRAGFGVPAWRRHLCGTHHGAAWRRP